MSLSENVLDHIKIGSLDCSGTPTGIESYEGCHPFPNFNNTGVWEHWNPVEEGIDPNIKERIYKADAEYVCK